MCPLRIANIADLQFIKGNFMESSSAKITLLPSFIIILTIQTLGSYLQLNYRLTKAQREDKPCMQLFNTVLSTSLHRALRSQYLLSFHHHSSLQFLLKCSFAGKYTASLEFLDFCQPNAHFSILSVLSQGVIFKGNTRIFIWNIDSISPYLDLSRIKEAKIN